MPKPRAVAAAVDETAISLAVDQMSVEVVRALAAAEVDAILLKGPAIVEQLYDPGEHRPYIDCDLLVPAASESTVAAVLRELGFAPRVGLGIPDPDAYEHPWQRGGDYLDEHVSLFGVAAPARSVWAILTADARLLRVAGHPMRVLGPGALALLVSLHAAADGPAGQKALEDLRRGLVRLGDAAWHQAAGLARALDALPAFGAGLALLPEGADRLARLGVNPGYDVAVALRAQGAPPLAHSLERIRQDQTLRAKLRRILCGLVPTPTYMRGWSALEGHHDTRLPVAYLRRSLWLVSQVAPGLRAWWRARHDEAQRRC